MTETARAIREVLPLLEENLLEESLQNLWSLVLKQKMIYSLLRKETSSHF